MPVILKSISLPHLRLFSDLILLAFSPKIEISSSDPREPDRHLESRAPLGRGFQSELQVIRHLL